jgi:hypothetical protein
MNKNANNRTNSNKQTSPDRGYYGPRFQTSKRDSVQSAKTRGTYPFKAISSVNVTNVYNNPFHLFNVHVYKC